MIPEKIPEINQLVENRKLYKMLVEQLNKDFVLAGVDYFTFSKELKIDELIKSLSIVIEKLFKGRYDSYLNFVYRVDVAEKEMLKVDSTSDSFFEDLAKVILKRELQKVWFRSKF